LAEGLKNPELKCFLEKNWFFAKLGTTIQPSVFTSFRARDKPYHAEKPRIRFSIKNGRGKNIGFFFETLENFQMC